MPRPIRAKAQVERSAIELFAARGIDGVSIGEVAAHAGVSQGALYRHYPGKDELAQSLFAAAYRRIGAELDQIRAAAPDLAAQLRGMVGHFCALYDSDPALFRFLLLAQHNFLPHLAQEPHQPPAVLARMVGEAVDRGELAPVEPALGAAAIMGIVLQAATFHLYGRITGPLPSRAEALSRAGLAALKALGPC